MDPTRWSRLGVFAFLDGLSAREAIGFARRVEQLGYATLWVVEALGRDVFAHTAALLAVTDRLILGAGVASVWARAAARAYMTTYLPHIEAYVRMLRELGFDDRDFAGDLSDRLVDAIVAWGDEAAVRARIDAHYAAGATHVCMLPLGANGGLVPDVRTLEALAPR